MTEHLSVVILCGIAWDVLTRIVTTILLTWPAWLLKALGALVACGVALTVLGLGTLVLFSLELYRAIEKERNRHA